MPTGQHKAKLLKPLGFSTRAVLSSKSRLRPPGPRNTYQRPPQPSFIPKPKLNPTQTPNPELSTSTPTPTQEPSPKVSVADALRETDATNNDLLAPVHIPEDPDGVLNERHPAAGILAKSAIVIQRQLELMNVMIGFEQANKYVILDPQGNHVGFIAERDLGMGNMMARQMFSTHRSFTTHVFDKYEKEVLRFHRPFSWISSRIGVYDPLEVAASSQSSSKYLDKTVLGAVSSDVNQTPAISNLALSEMRVIGEAQQQWALLRRKYNLFLFRQSPTPETDLGTHKIPSKSLPLSSSQQLQVSQSSKDGKEGQYGQFAYVDEPFLSWDFSLLSANSQLIGSVNRNFAGFGREIFTDTGVYALRMDAAGLAEEPRHLISKTGEKALAAYKEPHIGMTLDQRALMLATAVSIDFDYFSRKSGSSGLMPLWFPWGSGAEEAAGTTAGAGAGTEVSGEAGAGALGGVVRGAGTGAGAGALGEGAAVGAGSMAGYEAMQRGVYGDDASPASGQSPGAGQQGDDGPAQEEVWGEENNPWGGEQDGGGKSGGGGGGGEGGGGGGEGGDGFDVSDWF